MYFSLATAAQGCKFYRIVKIYIYILHGKVHWFGGMFFGNIRVMTNIQVYYVVTYAIFRILRRYNTLHYHVFPLEKHQKDAKRVIFSAVLSFSSARACDEICQSLVKIWGSTPITSRITFPFFQPDMATCLYKFNRFNLWHRAGFAFIASPYKGSLLHLLRSSTPPPTPIFAQNQTSVGGI